MVANLEKLSCWLSRRWGKREGKEERKMNKLEKKITKAETHNSKTAINRILTLDDLVRVFSLLPRADLYNARLVCRGWREVGEAPSLWAWVCLRASEGPNDWPTFHEATELLGSRRFQAVRSLAIHGEHHARDETSEVSEELLQAVVRHPVLSQLMLFRGTSLSSVDPELLAQAVSQLEELDLIDPQLTPQQLEAIFAALDASNKLKALRICDTNKNFSTVDPEVMARVLNKLEYVGLSHTGLTEQQMARILSQSLVTTNLKELLLKGNETCERELFHKAQLVIPNLAIFEFE